MAPFQPILLASAAWLVVWGFAVEAAAITVEEAVSAGCSTAEVQGLSLQIIAEGNCMVPGAYAELSTKPNVSLGSAVLPYLEEPARDALEQALDDNASTAMQINSMLRTVAQQYLLYRWYQLNTCGISLAASPGNSNHETGLAIDIQQYATWNTILDGYGFSWFGSSDPWHFDYTGPGAVDHKGVDVEAFQRLWNRNNPGDLIDEDGAYGPQTEARLQQSPAEGFPLGADCEPTVEPGEMALTGRFVAATDLWADGPSAGVTDLFITSAYRVEIDALNTGTGALSDVEVTIALPAEAILATDYELSSDGGTGGEHSPIDVSGNPSPDSLDETFNLSLDTIEPGETRRITLTVEAAAYTVDELDPVEISFSAGSTEGSLSADIYSECRWEWDGERLEGWTGADDETELEASDDGALSLSGDASTLAASSPTLTVPLDEIEGITLRARRTGPAESAATLYFSTDSQTELAETHSFPLGLPADGQPHEITLVGADLGDLFVGTLTGLHLVPFDDPAAAGAGSASIDYLRIGSAEVQPLVVPGANASCVCTAPGGSRGAARPPWILGLAVASAMAARRRRRIESRAHSRARSTHTAS